MDQNSQNSFYRHQKIHGNIKSVLVSSIFHTLLLLSFYYMKKLALSLFTILLLQSQLNAQISLGTGVALSYPFTGNANDASGNGHHGVVNGAILTTDRFGNPNQAYLFNGSTDYINTGNILNSVFSGVGNKFSISVWIKPTAIMNNNMILAKIADGACFEDQRQFYFRLWNSKIMFGYSSTLVTGNYRYPTGSTLVNDLNQWYYIVVMYDGTISTGDGIDRVKIYINGIAETVTVGATSTGTVGNIQPGSAPMGVGDYLNTSGAQCNSTAFNGKIDDLRIYDRLLNTAEISELFYGPTQVGIDEEAENILCDIYPNPSSGLINYSLVNISGDLTIKIVDILGKDVHQKKIVNNNADIKGTIDLSNQQKGIYFLQIKSKKGKITLKVVITD
jgi:hypothetical protein